MSPLMMFGLYAGAGLLVAAAAFLWGGPQKIFGAGLLMGSVILSNITLLVLGYMFPHLRDLTLLYIVMDLALAYIFVTIFADNSWLKQNKWAGVLALLHLIMTGVNFTGVLSKEFAMSNAHRTILNVLMIAAYITCLIGFIPKSMDEARGVLRTKWLFFMNDHFGRVRIEGDEAAVARKEKKTAFWISKLAWKNQSVWIDAHIGERIKAARNQAGITQAELAGILNISQAQVNRLESGDNRASANQLFLLSKVLDVDMNFFIEGLEARAALNPAKS